MCRAATASHTLPSRLTQSKSLYPADPCICHHHTGLNATPPQPLPQEVRFLTDAGSETEAPKGLTVSAASVPALSRHPLGMCSLHCIAPYSWSHAYYECTAPHNLYSICLLID